LQKARAEYAMCQARCLPVELGPDKTGGNFAFEIFCTAVGNIPRAAGPSAEAEPHAREDVDVTIGADAEDDRASSVDNLHEGERGVSFAEASP